MNTANTILAQLGGNKFLAMTGAKHLMTGGNDLTFKLPSRFAKDGINCVRVTLNGMDLYDVEFMKIRGAKVSEVASVEMVYADQLAGIFTAKTGLDTAL
jgi:hypothetical protein